MEQLFLSHLIYSLDSVLHCALTFHNYMLCFSLLRARLRYVIIIGMKTLHLHASYMVDNENKCKELLSMVGKESELLRFFISVNNGLKIWVGCDLFGSYFCSCCAYGVVWREHLFVAQHLRELHSIRRLRSQAEIILIPGETLRSVAHDTIDKEYSEGEGVVPTLLELFHVPH